MGSRTHIFAFLALLTLTSCGLRGGSSSIGDALPSSWVVLATAPIVAVSNSETSGQATIYKDPNGNKIYIRLESLSTPTGISLYLTANYTPGDALGASYVLLHGNSGNQNYSTNVISSNATGWVSVSIVSISTGSTVIYGTAAFNK